MLFPVSFEVAFGPRWLQWKAMLYSPRNDPDPEMIPNPVMIPKSTPKWSRPRNEPTFLLVDPEMIPKELWNGD